MSCASDPCHTRRQTSIAQVGVCRLFRELGLYVGDESSLKETPPVSRVLGQSVAENSRILLLGDANRVLRTGPQSGVRFLVANPDGVDRIPEEHRNPVIDQAALSSLRESGSTDVLESRLEQVNSEASDRILRLSARSLASSNLPLALRLALCIQSPHDFVSAAVQIAETVRDREQKAAWE